MARDAKIVQRGMNVQGNDLALPAGTPIYSLNASFTRDGVAERRVGFERFWDGLPWYQINDVTRYGKFHELFSKEHLFMDANGLMFTYDTVAADQWYSVPVNLPHRMQTLFSSGNTMVHSLGRALIGHRDGSNPFNWQSDASNAFTPDGVFAGNIGLLLRLMPFSLLPVVLSTSATIRQFAGRRLGLATSPTLERFVAPLLCLELQTEPLQRPGSLALRGWQAQHQTST